MKTDDPVPVAESQREEQIARIVKDTISSLSNRRALNEHAERQRDEIVQVLAECKGRVGGPNGAAARMGIRRTTLISRIQKLGINSYEFA
jgi:formate hydrogenlyase transcriptional activator